MPTNITGIKKLAYALLSQDNALGIAHGTPVLFTEPQGFTMDPKYDMGKVYAENRVSDMEQAFGECPVTKKLASLTNAERAVIFGQTTAPNGGVSSKGTDQPPFLAILYKASLRQGGFRYGVLYKGKFSPMKEDIKGQEGKVEFADLSVQGTFIQPEYDISWEYHVDTTDPNCPAGIDTLWFSAVQYPTATPTALALSSSTPTDDSVTASKTAAISMTFNNVMNQARTIALCAKASDGTKIALTATWDATGKILSLAHAALTGSTAYILTYHAVDVFGQTLDDTLYFTTVA